MTLISATGFVPLNREIACADWRSLQMVEDRPTMLLSPGYLWTRVVVSIDQHDATRAVEQKEDRK